MQPLETQTANKNEVSQACLHFLTKAKPLAEISEIHMHPVWPKKI